MSILLIADSIYYINVYFDFQVLKLYAWEDAFQDRISEIRKTECNLILKTALFIASFTIIFQTIPYFVSIK